MSSLLKLVISIFLAIAISSAGMALALSGELTKIALPIPDDRRVYYYDILGNVNGYLVVGVKTRKIGAIDDASLECCVILSLRPAILITSATCTSENGRVN